MPSPRDVEYSAWEASLPRALTDDPLWKVHAYRLGLFAADRGALDLMALRRDRRAAFLHNQLGRALSAISAKIAEGYSRSSPREKARFYEYALGSARESRDWYYKARRSLRANVAGEQIELLTHLVRLLTRMVQSQREKTTSKE